MCHSTGLVGTSAYNNRLQPCRISVKSSGTAPSTCSDTHVGNILDYTYNFSLGIENNGNVTSVTNNITPGRSQSYTYDELNRISTAVAQATSGQFCWGQDFTYDAWANLTNIILDPNRPGCSATGLSVAMVANNQLSAPPYHYDAAGNLTSDGTNSYTFNAENQVVTVAGVTYTYDGGGNRVKKSNGKLYWNAGVGEALDETDASGNLTDEYIFFGGRRIARRDSSNNVVYYFSDTLGTARVVTNSSGTIQDDSDFYPFGGERVVTSSSGNTYKFTGKERDTESGLDNFGARYYASTTGRFLSPDDTKYASLADPQTWNLYSYVSNHPLTMTDPTGHSADPWAGRLRGADYNSFIQEMQGGGVGSAMSGGDSGGADGDMSQATPDDSSSVQHQNDQNYQSMDMSNNGLPPNTWDSEGNSGPNAEPEGAKAATAASDSDWQQEKPSPVIRDDGDKKNKSYIPGYPPAMDGLKTFLKWATRGPKPPSGPPPPVETPPGPPPAFDPPPPGGIPLTVEPTPFARPVPHGFWGRVTAAGEAIAQAVAEVGGRMTVVFYLGPKNIIDLDPNKPRRDDII